MKDFFDGLLTSLNTKAEATFSKEFVADFKSGFAGFFKNIASFNNFILLSLAYFVGVGFSYLLYKRSQKKLAALQEFPRSAASHQAPLTLTPLQEPSSINGSSNSFWQEMDSSPRPADSFYRPF